MTARLDQLRLPMLLFILGCASFYPFWAIFQQASINDEGYISVGAVRLLAGEAIFRDFFSHFAPGTYYLTYLAYALLGPTVAVTRFLVALITGGLALCIFLIGKRILGDRGAIMPYLLFLCSGVTQWPILSHHWLAVLAFLLGVLALLRWQESPAEPARGLACGASCAVAFWIILPEAGALFLLTFLVAIIYRRLLTKRLLAAWLAGLVIFSALLWAPIVIHASLADIWQQTVAWALGHNVSGSILVYDPGAIFNRWIDFFKQLRSAHLSLAVCSWVLQSVSYLLCWSCNYLLFYPVFLLAVYLTYRKRPGSAHVLIVLAMFTHILSWSSRQTMLYINFLTPIFFILLAWILQRYKARILQALLICLYLLFFIYQCTEASSFIYPIKTARGTLYSSSLQTARMQNQVFQAMSILTPPGSSAFCFPYAMGYTYLSGIAPVSKLSSVVPLIGEADQLPLLLEAINKHRLPYIYYFPFGKDMLDGIASVDEEKFWQIVDESNKEILSDYLLFKDFGFVLIYKRKLSL